MNGNNRYSRYEPIFGSWYIKNRIGSGAIGQVFEIEREEMGVTYRAALKAMTIPDGPEDIQSAIFSGVAYEDLEGYYRNLMQDIVSELRYLSKLKGSSHILSYEDHQIIKHEDDIGWDILIKTELLTPLVEYSIRHTLSETEVLRLGIDICQALEFCNQYGIIHRDIKPENIFLMPSGDYKLGDFGIARVVEETQMSLSRKGTYSYMAPEVFHGQAYGPSADLYSLGLVMYKYLNHGRNPFMPAYPAKVHYDDAEKAFVRRMAANRLPDPATGSSKLRKILLKACAHNIKDRYSSAEEMRADLEALYYPIHLRALRGKRTIRKADKIPASAVIPEVAEIPVAPANPAVTKAAEASEIPARSAVTKAAEALELPASAVTAEGAEVPENPTATVAAEAAEIPATPMNSAAQAALADSDSVPADSQKRRRTRWILPAVAGIAAAAALVIYLIIPKEGI